VKQKAGFVNEEVIESIIKLKHLIAQDVTREEIKDAMFSLKNNKAPVPDGFNTGFLKKNVAHSWGRCNQRC